MALDQTQANSILSYLHKVSGTAAPRTLTGPIMVRLMSANGTASSNGTQVTGGSYAAQSAGSWTNTAATQTDATSGAVNFTGMPAITTVGIELWSSDATPVRTEFGSITSKTTAAGDTLSFAAGAITSALA